MLKRVVPVGFIRLFSCLGDLIAFGDSVEIRISIDNRNVMKNLFWDMKLSQSEIQIILDQDNMSNPLTASLYARILSSVAWYKILEQLNQKQLHSALSDEVIRRIKSKCLRDRFRYARNMLFENEVVNQ